jgi:hypothetical protein
MKKMSKREFVEKCEWEGGGLVSGFEYGIGANYLDDKDPIFKEMVGNAENHWKLFIKAFREIENKYGDWEDIGIKYEDE